MGGEYEVDSREVADSRTPGIFIQDTAYFHCDSLNYKSQFMKTCRIPYENAWRTGVRNLPINLNLYFKAETSTGLPITCLWVSRGRFLVFVDPS